MARCNCGERGCPWCDRLGSAQPWEPRAGTPVEEPSPEEIMALHRRWETWQAVRRYLLVLLLILVGSMGGSAITILAFIHYN